MASAKKYQLSLFIFRRDLRLEDNSALLAACQSSKLVIPCFIFDPRQYQNNPYMSNHSFQFMVESLQDLASTLERRSGKLFIFDGIAENVVQQLLKSYPIEAIFFNNDYTPFSLKRDQNLKIVCTQLQRDCITYDDALLISPEDAIKSDGKCYKVFTAFYKHALNFEIQKPKENHYHNYYHDAIALENQNIYQQALNNKVNSNPIAVGGRSACMKRLHDLTKLKHYEVDRDFPYKDASSHLSSYLKFTTCSIREVYYKIKEALEQPESLLRQLYWRDFFTLIAFHFPNVFGHSFNAKFQNLHWDSDKNMFAAWCQGQTGFPIVDAGMRQLNETGYMHNRVRLITGSFLVKDLHINWLQGERYFAQQLIDYDPALNNGNWQWVAGTGVDAQPYFRILNPWLQQKKYDPDCKYIKQWLPELNHLDPQTIHQWSDPKTNHLAKYPAPIVDHALEAAKTKKYFGV